MYKTGLVSISFRSLSVDEIIDLVKDAGLEAIEWGRDVHAPCDDVENLPSGGGYQEKEQHIQSSS